MICPNPACEADLEAFEVSTAYGLTGSRLVVNCPECEKTFEVEVLVHQPEPATAVFLVNRSETTCSNCGKNTLVTGVTHHLDISGYSGRPGEGCGARFVGIKSANGAVTDDDLRRMRPDLPIVPRHQPAA